MVVHACLFQILLVVFEHSQPLLLVRDGEEGWLFLDLADNVLELGLACDVFAKGVAKQRPEGGLELLQLLGLVFQTLLFPRFSLVTKKKNLSKIAFLYLFCTPLLFPIVSCKPV